MTDTRALVSGLCCAFVVLSGCGDDGEPRNGHERPSSTAPFEGEFTDRSGPWLTEASIAAGQFHIELISAPTVPDGACLETRIEGPWSEDKQRLQELELEHAALCITAYEISRDSPSIEQIRDYVLDEPISVAYGFRSDDTANVVINDANRGQVSEALLTESGWIATEKDGWSDALSIVFEFDDGARECSIDRSIAFLVDLVGCRWID